MVEDDHPILTKFKSEYPDRKVVLACEEDVTNDQKKDLLIIYKENSVLIPNRFLLRLTIRESSLKILMKKTKWNLLYRERKTELPVTQFTA